MLGKMADETVEYLVLDLVLMSAPVLIGENCDISISTINQSINLYAYAYVLVKTRDEGSLWLISDPSRILGYMHGFSLNKVWSIRCYNFNHALLQILRKLKAFSFAVPCSYFITFILNRRSF